MDLYADLHLWAPLPLISDDELVALARRYAGPVEKGPAALRTPDARPAHADFLRAVIVEELQARGIGDEPWWAEVRRAGGVARDRGPGAPPMALRPPALPHRARS